MKNINLGAHFLFLVILCSIKIERLLFLKFLKNLAFFDSYFWPFNKSEEKIKVIFVISAIIPSIWNVFIKFRWHDEKLTKGKMRIHCLENVDKALSFLYEQRVQLENMGAHDIVDGHARLTLGLIWTIILRFQIQDITTVRILI